MLVSINGEQRPTSHQRIMFLLLSLKSGYETEIGSSNWSITASEQVASKPIPLTDDGAIPESLTTRLVTLQQADQMSSVDCS